MRGFSAAASTVRPVSDAPPFAPVRRSTPSNQGCELRDVALVAAHRLSIVAHHDCGVRQARQVDWALVDSYIEARLALILPPPCCVHL
jgi:hypothetical protein